MAEKAKSIFSYDIEDRNTIIKFFSYITFFGIISNFSLFAIFGINFNYFTWIGWGLFIWIIEKKIIPIIRNIFIR